jgi:hypothetical protein
MFEMYVVAGVMFAGMFGAIGSMCRSTEEWSWSRFRRHCVGQAAVGAMIGCLGIETQWFRSRPWQLAGISFAAALGYVRIEEWVKRVTGTNS